MKRFLILICAAFMTIGVSAQDYYYYESEGPESGDWALGFGLNLGFGAGVTNFGIQVPRVQYYFASRVRAEFGFNYYFKNKEITDWNVDLDIHPYIIPIVYGMHVYPVVGLTFWHRRYSDLDQNIGRVGANVGAGFQYDITEKISANLQYKYMITNEYNHNVFNIGMSYRF